MSQQLTVSQFIENVQAARQAWEALLAQIDPAHMSTPGVIGSWSLKDLIAHVAWYEREMIGLLRERSFGGSQLWALPHDVRNRRIFEQNKDRPLEDVLREADDVFQQFMALLAGLTDEELHDPGKFAHMPEEVQPWQIIASNSYQHYQEHIPEAQAWLKKHRAGD